MRISILLQNPNEMGKKSQPLAQIVASALSAKGYNSYAQFREALIEKMKEVGTVDEKRVRTESQALWGILNGKQNSVGSDRARLYSELLDIPEQSLTNPNPDEGSVLDKTPEKRIELTSETDITPIIQELSRRGSVTTMRDLVKELLWYSISEKG